MYTKNDEQHWGVVRGSKPDELTHWKYIKRYKKNGKWRYVYNVGTTGDKINGETESPYREYSKLQDMLGYDERDAAAISDVKYRRKQENAMNYNHSQGENSSYSQMKSDRYFKEAERLGKRASEDMQRYYKTPIGKIDRFDDYIDKGRSKVAKALTKFAKRIAPKKESLISKTTTKNSYRKL